MNRQAIRRRALHEASVALWAFCATTDWSAELADLDEADRAAVAAEVERIGENLHPEGCTDSICSAE